jgi:hypothetical protein
MGEWYSGREAQAREPTEPWTGDQTHGRTV